MRCQGYRRYGGAFSLGPVVWRQCKEDAVATLTVVQDGKEELFPACVVCWAECVNTGIQIKAATAGVSEGEATYLNQVVMVCGADVVYGNRRMFFVGGNWVVDAYDGANWKEVCSGKSLEESTAVLVEKEEIPF